jgi:hypothetical protein
MGHSKVSKLSNGYADTIPSSVYESMPKTVLAAIAVSLATCGGDRLDDATRAIIHEWSVLHQNGIVPQAVPAALRKYDRPEDD